ncbi:unnamed protein product [Chrysoparadoxa australica]
MCWEAHELDYFLPYINQKIGVGVDDVESGVEAGQGDLPMCPAICLCTVLSHALHNACFFPGLCVDEEVTLMEGDHYDYIPHDTHDIRNAVYVWKGGVALPDESTVVVNHLDANRVEVLHLLLVSLAGALGQPEDLYSGYDRWCHLAASGHLPFSNELFFSLLNTVLASQTKGGWGLNPFEGLGGSQREQLTAASVRVLLALLLHGQPYRKLAQEAGVDYEPAPGAPFLLPVQIRQSLEQSSGFNCHRRSLSAIFSEEDLAQLGHGLLSHLCDACTSSQESSFRYRKELLLLLGQALRENAAFAHSVAANADLSADLVVSMCYLSDLSVARLQQCSSSRGTYAEGSDDGLVENLATMQDQQEAGWNDVGTLQMAASILLQMSRLPAFTASLCSLGIDPLSAVADDLKPEGASYLDMLVILSCSVLEACTCPNLKFLQPIMGAVVRNALSFPGVSPLATETVDAIAMALHANAAGHECSAIVASLLLEGVAAAVCADLSGHSQLVLAVADLHQNGTLKDLGRLIVEEIPVGQPTILPPAPPAGMPQPEAQGGKSSWLSVSNTPGFIADGWPFKEVLLPVLANATGADGTLGDEQEILELVENDTELAAVMAVVSSQLQRYTHAEPIAPTLINLHVSLYISPALTLRLAHPSMITERVRQPAAMAFTCSLRFIHELSSSPNTHYSLSTGDGQLSHTGLVKVEVIYGEWLPLFTWSVLYEGGRLHGLFDPDVVRLFPGYYDEEDQENPVEAETAPGTEANSARTEANSTRTETNSVRC